MGTRTFRRSAPNGCVCGCYAASASVPSARLDAHDGHRSAAGASLPVRTSHRVTTGESSGAEASQPGTSHTNLSSVRTPSGYEASRREPLAGPLLDAAG
jgi:hypothetical protein